MRFGVLVLSTVLSLATLAPLACSSFDSATDRADAGALDGANTGVDGESDSASAVDALPGAGSRAERLYIFGGVTIVGAFEETVFESYAASILDDGSLGPWERVPALDIGRSYMTTIARPELLVMAGGNGRSIGQDASANHTFFREDVGAADGDPPGPWRAAPSLGTGNGRWAAAGTFVSGRAYVGGGIVAGDQLTNTVFAAPVSGAPAALQGWQSVGTLPFVMADHGLVGLGSRLYVLGGSTAGDGDNVLLADTSMTPIAADGTLGDWTPTGKLPKTLAAFGVVDLEGRVFVIGGEDVPGSISGSVFIGSQIQTQDLIWQETTPLATARKHLCTVGANGRLYVLGGSTVSEVTSFVDVGEVNGTSVTWKQTTPMPIARSAFGCAAR